MFGVGCGVDGGGVYVATGTGDCFSVVVSVVGAAGVDIEVLSFQVALYGADRFYSDV